MPRLRTTLLLLVILPLSGCGLGDLIEFSCMFMGDPDHCYQSAAVQSSDSDDCAKIKGEGFSGSNPPRDKCYLLIAENTGDYSACDKIEGGMMSYSREQCITSAALKNEDPDGCKRLTGSELDACKAAFAASITPDRLKEINEAVETAKSEAGANPDDKEAQERLKKLLAQQAGLFDSASPEVKSEFFKSAREEIMADIDDDDVRSEIARLLIDHRDRNPGMSLNDQLKKLEEIKEQQELTKRLDEQANQLMDQVKEGATQFASDTIDDLYGDDIAAYEKAMQDKARKLLEESGGQKMKDGIASLESLKEKYDKASEQYEAISAQIEKLQKVYDEVSEVYKKVDDINKLVAEGKIDVGRAKVLHGAVYLGKGLEYATAYIPVFGSTASTISKELMDATVRFATSRAARTTAIDKCIEDPENCDPTGITPY